MKECKVKNTEITRNILSTMKIPLRFLILAFCGIILSSASQVALPDIIIGDPYKDKNDILGPPLSEKEIKESMNLKMKYQHLRKDRIFDSGFFEGDIMIQSEYQLQQILEGDPKGQLSAMTNPAMTWPNGVIPYVISAEFSHTERYEIAKAIHEYHQRTCLKFVPRTIQADYVHIIKGNDCSSNVGRIRGEQSLSLGEWCVDFGTILHEFMHAAGFWHEQSRHDRDDYVAIQWNNIQPDKKHNFNKYSSYHDLGLPYDYSSIMHYKSYEFSRNGYPTIVSRRRGVKLGQSAGFSKLDVRGLNLLYRCSSASPAVVPPQPKDCSDELSSCSHKARLGFCTTHADFMLKNCKKSCNFCGNSVCQDQEVFCRIFANKDNCRSYMHLYCKKSCGMC